jgi:hypothetical protein
MNDIKELGSSAKAEKVGLDKMSRRKFVRVGGVSLASFTLLARIIQEVGNLWAFWSL